MMRKIFFLIPLLAMVMGVSAQTPAATTQDKKAKEILNKASAKFKKMSTVKANFSYTLENKKAGVKETQKGLVLLKGNKFKIEMGAREVFCDSKTLWVYLKSQNEVQVSAYQPSTTEFSPQNLFTMHEKGFDYKYVAEKNGIHEIELTPQDKNKKFFKIKLFVNKKNDQISKAIIFDKSGNIYTYEVSGLVANTAMADNLFTFDPASHPGVEVID